MLCKYTKFVKPRFIQLELHFYAGVLSLKLSLYTVTHNKRHYSYCMLTYCMLTVCMIEILNLPKCNFDILKYILSIVCGNVWSQKIPSYFPYQLLMLPSCPLTVYCLFLSASQSFVFTSPKPQFTTTFNQKSGNKSGKKAENLRKLMIFDSRSRRHWYIQLPILLFYIIIHMVCTY